MAYAIERNSEEELDELENLSLRLITEDESDFSLRRMSFYDMMGVLSGRVTERMVSKVIGSREPVDKSFLGIPDLNSSQSQSIASGSHLNVEKKGSSKKEKTPDHKSQNKKSKLREIMEGSRFLFPFWFLGFRPIRK